MFRFLYAEQVGIAVTFYTRMRTVLGSNSGQDVAVLSDVFRGFPQYAQENSRMVPRLGHDRVLSDPFQFVIH